MKRSESGRGRPSPWWRMYRRRARGPGRRGCRAWASRAVLAPVVFALVGVAAAAEDGRSYLDLSAGFKTGDFGTPVTSSLYYLAPAFGYVAPRYDVSVTVPYLALTSEAAGQSTTDTGIGDVIVRGGAELWPAGHGLSLYTSLSVKLPTADETKGLGTGETDVGAFATLSSDLEALRLSLFAGYIKVGEPRGQSLNDVLLYGLGLSGALGQTHLYGSLEGRTATVPGADDPLETYVGVLHPLRPRQWLKGNALVGLNDGGPRFGASLGFVQWF